MLHLHKPSALVALTCPGIVAVVELDTGTGIEIPNEARPPTEIELVPTDGRACDAPAIAREVHVVAVARKEIAGIGVLVGEQGGDARGLEQYLVALHDPIAAAGKQDARSVGIIAHQVSPHAIAPGAIDADADTVRVAIAAAVRDGQ